MKRKHVEVKHFSHPHDLHLIDLQLPKETPQKNCHGCNILLFGSCYNCSTCNFYLHQYCFDLPPSIQTPIHPQHALSLLHSQTSSLACNVCGESCTNFLIFHCSFCNFSVHANCAGPDETKCRDDNERYLVEFTKQKLEENKMLRAKIDELQKNSNNICHEAECEMSIDQTPNEIDLLRTEQEEYYNNKFHQVQMKSNALSTEMEYYASVPKFDHNNLDQFF